jgi:hypothetical protein
MIVYSWLRESGILANLRLCGAIYDNQPFEAMPHYHIIVANFDHLFGHTALCILSVFFALARYRVVKIVHSCSEVVLRTMMNYKAHYSLS